jgi:hypothetical protein
MCNLSSWNIEKNVDASHFYYKLHTVLSSAKFQMARLCK